MYPQIFQNLKHIVTQIIKKYNLVIPTAKIGRPLKIKPIDAITLTLYQHRSTRATKKSVYDDFKKLLRCSYKTLVVRMNDSGKLALNIIQKILDLNQTKAHHIKYTDATDIPVCLKKNADSNKTMRGLASFGHSTKGFYYGLKMTMTRDADGRILNLRFSSANKNDRDLFRDVNQNIHGLIIADAGYVSKELEQNMHIEGKRTCLIRPFKSMKKLATAWQLASYKRRFDIEFDFRSLKLFHGLLSSLPRSINGMIANYLYALLSFMLVKFN